MSDFDDTDLFIYERYLDITTDRISANLHTTVSRSELRRPEYFKRVESWNEKSNDYWFVIFVRCRKINSPVSANFTAVLSASLLLKVKFRRMWRFVPRFADNVDIGEMKNEHDCSLDVCGVWQSFDILIYFQIDKILVHFV